MTRHFGPAIAETRMLTKEQADKHATKWLKPMLQHFIESPAEVTLLDVIRFVHDNAHFLQTRYGAQHYKIMGDYDTLIDNLRREFAHHV